MSRGEGVTPSAPCHSVSPIRCPLSQDAFTGVLMSLNGTFNPPTPAPILVKKGRNPESPTQSLSLFTPKIGIMIEPTPRGL